MRRYGLVDIPDEALDIDAVPLSRTITINGVTYDLSSDRTWTVSGSGIAIGGTITGGTTGSVLFVGASSTIAQDNPNLFWDDTNNYLGIGTNTPVTSLTVSTASASTPRGITLHQTSADTTAGLFTMRKSRGTGAVVNGDNIGNLYSDAFDGTQYTSGGRIRFSVDGTVSNGVVPTSFQFFTGTSGTGIERLRVTSSGATLIGTTTATTNYLLSVNGGANFGSIAGGGGLTGVIIYPTSISTRLAVLQGPIWCTNVADVSLYIDGGGTIAGNNPVRIYTEPYSGVTTQFPLCIQGAGLETIFGQNTITTNPSSLVTMVSTTKGFLPPRMTSAQRTAIASPATGLIVYQTDGTAGLYLRNSAAWVLIGSGGGGGTGTVTSVSVVSANGLAGTVATATTTPAITLSTTITGMLKGNGTAISAAVAGTDYQTPLTAGVDYQQPITLTTTGTGGVASFVGNNLNIPNYTSTSAPTSDGVYTPTISATSNCTNFTTSSLHYFRVGNVVHVAGKINFNPSTITSIFSFKMSIPVSANLTTTSACGGTCARYITTTAATPTSGNIRGGGLNLVEFNFSPVNYSGGTGITDWFFTFTYYIGGL